MGRRSAPLVHLMLGQSVDRRDRYENKRKASGLARSAIWHPVGDKVLLAELAALLVDLPVHAETGAALRLQLAHLIAEARGL